MLSRLSFFLVLASPPLIALVLVGYSHGGAVNNALGSCASRIPLDGSAGSGSAGGTNATKECLPDEWDGSTDDVEGGAVTSEASYEVSSPASAVVDEFGADIGEKQVMDAYYSQEILDRIADARKYLTEEVQVDDRFDKVRGLCTNKHESCAYWAVLGECENNPGYMTVNCAPVCNSCEQMHVDTRCPLDPDAEDALHPGDLNKMFERIVTNPEYQKYEPRALSRPGYAPGDSAETADYKVDSLWLVMFENIVSDEEAERLIELGGIEGYERSSDVGSARADGTYTAETNSGRTSTNAWCSNECYRDPVARDVMDRIANITGIPEPNSEYLQLLRYEKAQFYQTHNDYIPYQVKRPSGVRMLTFYIYLSDVEEGGGTNFPRLGLTVQPKKGRAVLWPSVFDEDPDRKDARSDHQAMPVIKGVKYGANAWIHQRDFKEANARGCS